MKVWAFLLNIGLLLLNSACTEVIPHISVNGSLSNGIWIHDPITQKPQNEWILTKETDIETLTGYCRPEISRLALKSSQTSGGWIDVMSFAPHSEIRCAMDGTFILRIPTNSGPFSFSADQDFESALQIRGLTENKQYSDWLIQMSYDADVPVLIVTSATNTLQALDTLVFRYRLSRANSTALNWNMNLAQHGNGSASNFISSFPSSVSIPANTTIEQSLSIPLVNPAGACRDEILVLKTTSLDGARISAEPSVLIRDNRPTIQLTEGATLNVSESLGAIRFNVSINESCQYPITLGFSISEGPAAPFARLGADYSSPSPGNFFVTTIPAGQTNFEVISPLAIIDDSTDEYDENMNLILQWAQDTVNQLVLIGDLRSNPIRILDNDESPTLSLILPNEVSELAGQFIAEFRLDRPTEKVISFPFSLESGTAPSAQVVGPTLDLQAPSTTRVDFGMMQTVYTTAFSVRDDDLFEALLERFQVRVPSDDLSDLANTTDVIAVSDVRDNELPPVFSLIGSTEIIEGTNASLKFRSSVKIQGNLTLNLSQSGSATISSDYNLSSTSVTFNESDFESSSFNIVALADSTSPEPESIILSGVSLTGPRGQAYHLNPIEIRVIDVPPDATLNPFIILGVGGHSNLGTDSISDSSFNYFDPSDDSSTLEINWTSAGASVSNYDISLRRLDGTIVDQVTVGTATSFAFNAPNLGLSSGATYRIQVTARNSGANITLDAENNDFEFLVNRPPQINRNEIHTLSGNTVTIPLLTGNGVANLQGLDLDGDSMSIIDVVGVDPLPSHGWSWTSSTLTINGGWDTSFNGPGGSRIRIRFQDSRGYEATKEIALRSYVQDSTWIGAVSSSWNDRANWCGTVKADLTGCEAPTAAPTNRNMGAVFLNGDLSAIDSINIDSGLNFTGSAEVRAKKIILNAGSNFSASKMVLGESATFNGNNRIINLGELRLAGVSASQKSIFNSTSSTLKLRSLYRDSSSSDFVEFNHNSGTVNFGPWFGQRDGVINWGSELELNNLRYDFGNLEFRHLLESPTVIRTLGSLHLNASQMAVLDVPIVHQGTSITANAQAPSDDSEGEIRLANSSYTISPITTNGVAAIHRLKLEGNISVVIGNGASSRLAITREFAHLGTSTATLPALSFWQRGHRELKIGLRSGQIYPQIEIIKLPESSSATIDWQGSGVIRKLAVQNQSSSQMNFSAFPNITIREELKWLSIGAGPISNLSEETPNLDFSPMESIGVGKITISVDTFSSSGQGFELKTSGNKNILIDVPTFSRPHMNFSSGITAPAETFVRGQLHFENYTQIGASAQTIRIQSDQSLQSQLSLSSNPVCDNPGTNFIKQTYSPLGLGPQRSQFTYPAIPAVPSFCTVSEENSFGANLPVLSGF